MGLASLVRVCPHPYGAFFVVQTYSRQCFAKKDFPSPPLRLIWAKPSRRILARAMPLSHFLILFTSMSCNLAPDRPPCYNLRTSPCRGRVLEKGGERSMNMVPVSSSEIASVGYENGTLHIRFHSGGLYQYTNVPASLYQGLIAAASKGRYFHANIKGRYGDHRIG